VAWIAGGPFYRVAVLIHLTFGLKVSANMQLVLSTKRFLGSLLLFMIVISLPQISFLRTFTFHSSQMMEGGSELFSGYVFGSFLRVGSNRRTGRIV